MRKIFTIVAFALFFTLPLTSQTVIYDNGPILTHPGAGAGGADVSAINTGLTANGFNINYGNVPATWMADDFTVPAFETWTIDSIVSYGYQTNSGNTSTITGMYAVILSADPSTGPINIVWGDTMLAPIYETKFSNIYRASRTTLTNTARPLMRTAVEASPAAVLTEGTYWLMWAFTGSVASGPWIPPIAYADTNMKATGNGMQRNAGAWVLVTDGASYGQGFPFWFVGSKVVGIKENSNAVSVSIYPNPVTEHANFHIGSRAENASGYTLVVYDLLGKEVKRAEAIKTSYQLSRGDLNDGIYMYELYDGDVSVKRGKLILE